MTEYSNLDRPSRFAREGEILFTFRFPNERMALASALDIGGYKFAAPLTRHSGPRPVLAYALGVGWKSHDVPAICIPAGALVRMSRIPLELRRRYILRSVEDVWFLHQSHHLDSDVRRIRFSNGREVFLEALPEGVEFVLLSPTQEIRVRDLPIVAWPEAVAA